tara:strand:- start:82 stop:288 length:207 start_codon:yes stop_codon:yes gene_type:complete
VAPGHLGLAVGLDAPTRLTATGETAPTEGHALLRHVATTVLLARSAVPAVAQIPVVVTRLAPHVTVIR